MNFRTRLDITNRQVKQLERTDVSLSGSSVFGLPFSALTTGPSQSVSGISETVINVVSTFSGNTGTTVFTFGDSRMNLGTTSFSAITPSNSAITQDSGNVWTGNTSQIVDGNFSYLDYSGVSFNLSVTAMTETSPNIFTGSCLSDDVFILSADTLDFTGRTIWVDNPEITRTNKLIVSDGAISGYVLKSDSEGMATWQVDASGSTFTGNTSATCISDIFVSKIHSCSPLNINPLDEGDVFFGSTSGVTIDVINSRIGVGKSPDYPLDIVVGSAHFEVKENGSVGNIVIMSGGTTGLTQVAVTADSLGGSIGVRGGADTTWTGYGAQGDMFLYSGNDSNGLNIISQPGTGTDDYIRFFAGQAAGGAGTPDLYIQGSGATKGYVAVGHDTPTEKLHLKDGDFLMEDYNGSFFSKNLAGKSIALSGGTTGLTRMDIAADLAGGSIGVRGFSDTIGFGYGKQGDMFLYSGNDSNGLNFVSSLGTGTEDYIRFFAGQDANGVPDIYIQGSGATKGYVALGHDTPTEKLHLTDGDILVETSNGSFFSDLDNAAGALVALSGLSTDLTRFGVLTPNSESLTMGIRGSAEVSFSTYGKQGDSFIYSSNQNNGLNLISSLGTGTDDYIRLFAGQDANGVPDIHIQGSGATRGYVAVGHDTPTEVLDVLGSIKMVDGNQSNGYVMTSDGNGVATWQAGASGGTSPWTAGTGTDSATLIGGGNIANTKLSVAEGSGTTASGLYSHAEGEGTTASGDGSHAEGYGGTASGDQSHVEGINSFATGLRSHAEGFFTTASAAQAHAEGSATMASGVNSHAEGQNTIASGQSAHAEGQSTVAGGINSHAGGDTSEATGVNSFVHAKSSVATGQKSFVGGGEGNSATANNSVVMGGSDSIAGGIVGSAVVGGSANIASGDLSVVVGGSSNSATTFTASVIGGNFNLSCGSTSMALGGNQNRVDGGNSFAVGGDSNNVGVFGLDSGIVGGNNNVVLSGVSETVIVGGSNITATTDSMVYVPDLVIDGLVSTDPLATDANGKIVAGASDARLKTNINVLDSALDKIKNLRGISYEWTEESNMGAGVKKYGLIAQEVQEVIPDMVRERAKGDGMLTLAYTEVVPWLIEAIKELASGSTVRNELILETQTIASEDNNIELNYGGNHETAKGGGVKILNAIKDGGDSEFKTDENGRWIVTPSLATPQLSLPEFTPTATNDEIGDTGDTVWDDDYIYIKTNSGWKRTSLENF